MAQDTTLTARAGASMVGALNCLKVMHRYVDFTANNLANAAHYELFTLPAGTLVIAGVLQIVAADAGGGTLSMGVGGTGTGLLNAQGLGSETAVKLTAGGVQVTTAADTVDLLAGTAAITTAKIHIFLVVLDPTGAPAVQ